jgi:hypothetical protein
MCFVVSEHVLYLEIQCARRDKEEVENWRQRSRNPSVPVEYLCIFLVLLEILFSAFGVFSLRWLSHLYVFKYLVQ